MSLTYQNLRDIDRFGYKKFEKYNFHIQHWNMGYIFYKKYNDNYKPIDSCNLFKNTEFKSTEQLNLSLNEVFHKTLVIDPWGLTNYQFINRLFNKPNIFLCSFFLNNNLVSNSIIVKGLDIIKYFIRKNIKSFKKFKYLDYYLYAGIESKYNARFITNSKTKILEVNSFDYYNYINVKKFSKKFTNKYALFLDEGVINHPDKMLNETDDKDINIKKKYILDLNKFFDIFEKEYKIKIIVAAHPRIKYDNKSNIYNNRDIYYNKSAELIKNSEYVFVHTSQSHTLAVINFKKIIFITSDIFNNRQKIL